MPTTTDHDPIDFTFADDGDLVRRAPKAVPEDPVEKRLLHEREAAEHDPWCGLRGCKLPCGRVAAIEVKHGSGKVKI